MHEACRSFVAAWANVIRPPRSVVEVGSYDVNGSVRDLFAGSRYLGIDLRAGPGVDVVADGASWQPEDWPLFDLVLCLETLEHAPDPRAVCRNLVRLAAPGGLILVTAAGPLRLPHSRDGHPLPVGEAYRNLRGEDLARWLDGCQSVLVEDLGEDVRAAAVRPPR
jgi:SAM-dependent methyltransferase